MPFWSRRKGGDRPKSQSGRDVTPDPPPHVVRTAEPELPEHLRLRLADFIADHVTPCARISTGAPTADATSSYLFGHPYLPEGRSWPMIGGRAAVFVAQVNFRDVPALPDFPATGLLQWFVADDPTLGLTWGETAGRVGFELRWFADASAPSRFDTVAPVPVPGHPKMTSSSFVPPATSLQFAAGESLPGWEELPEEIQRWPVWEDVAVAVGEDPVDVEFAFNEYVRGVSGPFGELGQGSKVGGHASFAQTDPRAYPDTSWSTPSDRRLLVELEGDDNDGWKGGVGHIFGDPRRLAVGDLTGCTYHWDFL